MGFALAVLARRGPDGLTCCFCARPQPSSVALTSRPPTRYRIALPASRRSTFGIARPRERNAPPTGEHSDPYWNRIGPAVTSQLLSVEMVASDAVYSRTARVFFLGVSAPSDRLLRAPGVFRPGPSGEDHGLSASSRRDPLAPLSGEKE